MSNISDEDDDEEELEVEQDILTRDGIWTHIDASSNGQKSLDIMVRLFWKRKSKVHRTWFLLKLWVWSKQF